MKNTPFFLTIDNVLDIHRRVVFEFGGSREVRDFGLLESAVAMPGAGFGQKFLHKSLAAMAAAYLFHICRNHPFVDGNKRTAAVCAELFLLLNNRQLRASGPDLEKLVMGIAEGSISKQETVAFFRSHVKGGKKKHVHKSVRTKGH